MNQRRDFSEVMEGDFESIDDAVDALIEWMNPDCDAIFRFVEEDDSIIRLMGVSEEFERKRKGFLTPSFTPAESSCPFKTSILFGSSRDIRDIDERRIKLPKKWGKVRDAKCVWKKPREEEPVEAD